MDVRKAPSTLLLTPFLLYACIMISAYNTAEVKIWCSKTPHPRACEDLLLSHNPTASVPASSSSIKVTKTDFLKLSKQLALERALRAQKNTYEFRSKCKNEKAEAAWADCLDLFEQAVLRLNQTVDPAIRCSRWDSQTWLSTALTNLETCRLGFLDLGVESDVVSAWPLMNDNLSSLISNTLAINRAGQGPERARHGNGRFPSWVKPGDRKLLQSSSGKEESANAVVAKDGSGDYETIKEAVAAAGKRMESGGGRFVIYVKSGVYNENVEIKAKSVMLVGDGMGKTVVTGSKSVGGGTATTTFRSATVAVTGDNFMARDITFRNTAGPQKGQAVALRSGSDLSVFYRCSFEGYQDTIYVHSDRQFYRNCDIYGTVDFIFGNAAVVFQNCNIYPRNPPHGLNIITAQSRTDPNQNTGISIHNSRVTAAPDLRPAQGSVRTYLGRPWKKYSRTVFMKTYLDGLIEPAGWLEWNGDFALKTLYYGEYANTGPGSKVANRVEWPGYRAMRSAAEASDFTVDGLIIGNSWLPATSVPFTSGL